MNRTVPVAAADQPATVHFLGNLLTFRARSCETQGRFSLVESLTAPGAGSPPHRQNDEEAFLVLEGSFEFVIDGASRICGPGDFVFVPPHAIHAFRNCGEQPAKMLILNLPGGLHEGFFLAAGEPVAHGTTAFPPMTPPDIPAVTALAARFGIDILPPAAA